MASTQSAMLQRGTGGDGTDVSTECVEYRRMTFDWQLVHDLMGGTKAMRAASTRWLPQEPREDNQAYAVRLNRSTFFNAFKRAVQSLAGRPFSKPVSYGEHLDETLKGFLDDVDLNGRSMDVFLRDIFEAALADGIRYVLVDKSTKPPDEITAADELRYARRPYLVEIDPRNLISWRYEYQNGWPFLTEVRIREAVTEQDGDWGEKEITQYRVLRPGSWEIWRKVSDQQNSSQGNESVDKEDWVLDDEGTTDLSYIPLVPIYTGRKGFMVAEPPLIDLAWENVHHWQSRSDQNHCLHVARVPVWFGKGLDPITNEGAKVEYEISPNAMITTSNANGDIKIIEHTGAAIEAGNKDLENCEGRMAILGTELLRKAVGTALKTATEIDVDAQAQYSSLAMIVLSLEKATETMIEFMGAWEGKDVPDGKFVGINKEYGLAGRIELLAEVRQARRGHDLSRKTYLQEMKRHGALGQQVDVDEEMDLIDQEPPDMLGDMMPAVAAAGGKPNGGIKPNGGAQDQPPGIRTGADE